MKHGLRKINFNVISVLGIFAGKQAHYIQKRIVRIKS
jgi:hypothetical protein